MAFLDEIGRSFSNAGQNAVRQAKDIAEASRLSGLVNDNLGRIDSINRRIGEIYFKLHEADPADDFAELVKEERRLLDENEKMTDILMELRGQVRCSKCGYLDSTRAPYCPNCGARMIPRGMVECPSCGNLVREGSAFCTQCGKPMNEGSSSEPVEPQQ